MRILLAVISFFALSQTALAAGEAASKIAMSPIPHAASATAAPALPVIFTTKVVTDAPLPGDFTEGKKNAPITMIEYASMSCPHCAHFSNTVMPDLEKHYIATGKVRYILRQFPLNEPALKAADLMQCAGEQDNDKYFAFARALFDAQSKWAFDNNFMEGLQTFATVGGMSQDDFKKCMSDKKIEDKVLLVKKQAADEVHVPYTPYIIINGTEYKDGNSYEAISKYLDGLSAPKKPAKKQP